MRIVRSVSGHVSPILYLKLAPVHHEQFFSEFNLQNRDLIDSALLYFFLKNQ